MFYILAVVGWDVNCIEDNCGRTHIVRRCDCKNNTQAPPVTAGIRCDARNNDSTACAQPREKEIYDFVFERGKGTANLENPKHLHNPNKKAHNYVCLKLYLIFSSLFRPSVNTREKFISLDFAISFR